MELFQENEKAISDPTHERRRSRPAAVAVILYVLLILGLRNGSGGFPVLPGISDLDGRLYSWYLDAIAALQSSMGARWAVAFLSTLAAECSVLGLMVRTHPFPAIAKAGFLANLSTHPAFWYLLTGIERNYALWVVCSELTITGVEALVLSAALRNIGLRRAMVLSLAANGVSFILGLLTGVP